ncbi:MAG: MYXO-CTERM sorting domain-containing protein [Myxococcales bacterium]|nr:MYXO-CTERM sorting domain-containing protein [Myxococcales bacterium]
MTGDPGMSRGFFMTDDPLRDLDPPNYENTWPNDLVGEVHEDGLIIGQALWDMRKELVAKLGETEGVARANHLYYQALRRAVDIPSMHTEVLAADDDDGDVTNGTPNVCEINRAFRRHGLVPVNAASTSLGVMSPKQEGFAISVELTGLFAQCDSDQLGQAVLTWRNRDEPSEQGSIVMDASGNLLSAVIPTQEAGSVVEYGVNVAFTEGNALNLPDNEADPWYEFFVGDVIPLYCTTFESDPEAEGWTHGLAAGEPNEGADDWGWGPPRGNATNGDPTAAYSGENVFGNDLVPEPNYNGNYQSNIENWAKTPVVSTQGYENVRLQYRRWLNVEDAHFDKASIKSNETVVWTNLDSEQGDASNIHHKDKEWRFSDVDLSKTISPEGTVQVGFWLDTDQGLEMGGWTLDDVCIVALQTSAPTDPCADGGCSDAGGAGAGGAPEDGADPADGDLEAAGGCGCRTVGAPPDGRWLAGLLGLAALVARRRRPL